MKNQKQDFSPKATAENKTAQLFKAIFRSSRSEVFWEKGVLRNFAEFTGKHLCQSLFFNKVAGLRQNMFYPVLSM